MLRKTSHALSSWTKSMPQEEKDSVRAAQQIEKSKELSCNCSTNWMVLTNSEESKLLWRLTDQIFSTLPFSDQEDQTERQRSLFQMRQRDNKSLKFTPNLLPPTETQILKPWRRFAKSSMVLIYETSALKQVCTLSDKTVTMSLKRIS